MKHDNEILILCKNENSYLAAGLFLLIRSVLHSGARLRVSDDFSASSICKADIIVMSSSSLLLYLCHPNFRFRKPHSMIISMHNKQGRISNQDLPSCFSDVMIIRRDDSLASTQMRLRQKIATLYGPGTPFAFSLLQCTECKCRHLSRCQLQLVAYMREGLSMQCIARNMKVSVKTVYTHKYRLMEKFDARGDAELNRIIHLIGQNVLPGEYIAEGERRLL